MKPSKLLVSLHRQSVGRITFILASCVAAGAVALAAPQQGGPSLRVPSKLANSFKKVPVRTTPDSLVSKVGSVHVMVELDAPSASVVYGEALKAAQANAPAADPTRVPMAGAETDSVPRVEIDSAAAARVANHVSALDSAQQALLPSITNAGGKVLFRAQRAYNGVAVRIAPEKIADLAKLPGVKSVRPMVKKFPTAFSDVEFLGAPSFWAKTAPSGTNVRGNGIKIAIIDSGLDYTHSNFGGPGTPNYAGITDNTPVPNAYFPTPKVPFGYDFVGDNYDADGSPEQQEAHPDDNPLDSNGHGTACASLAAGFGVNAGGTTFTGPYDGAVPYAALKISPGMAPRAKLIPLRVFGTSGTTFFTTAAIEYAMDPNGDGNLNDHVDIISMSLGSNWGTPDDDSAIAAANAVAAGVIVTAASGNAGDTYYITSSPASAPGVISVAASFNDREGYIADASVVAKKPAELAGNKSYGIATTNSSNGTVTGNIVKLVPNSTGDDTKPTNAEFLKGKIAYADRVPGQGANTAARAKKAGAIGLIYGADETGAGGNPFRLTTDNDLKQIPEIVISKDDGTFIKDFSQFDEETGKPQNPITATIKPDYKVLNDEGQAADTMPTYSSRGPLLGSTSLKPDITAPAEFTGVALTGSGTGVELFNGTSSATPHVAGGLALMKQLHPNWSVEEIMALAMNTATHDLYEESGQAGYSAPTETKRGVSRVGAGRLDLNKASQSKVVAFNKTDANRVSVSFGNVEVPVTGNVSLPKEVTIRNKGGEDMEYDLTYDSRQEVGDATFQSVGHISVPAHSEKTITVTFTATGETLRHTKDASVTDFQVDLPRQYLSEAAGYGVLTPSTSTVNSQAAPQIAEQSPTIRIPLYAAPKPVGLMRTAQEALTPPANNAGTFNLQLTGDYVFTGENTPVDILGLVKPFECQYVSKHAGSSNFSSDPNVIKYVGVSSDYAVQTNKKKTAITFAIEGFGDASVPSYFSSDKEVYIDVNFDGKDDFVIYADQFPNTNVYLSHLVDANTFGNVAGGYQYLTNIFPGAALDTNAFNNSIIMLTVDAEALGYTGFGQTFFQYHVATFGASGLTDLTPYLRYDIAKPGLDGTGPTGDPEGDGGGFYLDIPSQFGGPVKVAFNGANFQANKSKGVLMAHMHNERGHRGELVEIRTPKISDFTPKQGPVGTTVTISGEGFGNGTKVEFSPNKPATNVNVISNNTISCKVPAGAVTGPITVSNSAGGDSTSGDFKVTP